MEGDVITLQDLFTFDFAAGRDDAGRFRGQLDEHRPAAPLHPGPGRPGGRPADHALPERFPMTARPSTRTRLGAHGRLAAAALVVAAGIAVVPAVAAAADAVPATLGDVRTTTTAPSARTLVLRGDTAAAVDPASVKVTVGGKPAVVTVAPAAEQPRSTMLVIDTSGSMGASGMATMRAAVKDFLSAVPKDVKVGVVSFASTVRCRRGADDEPREGAQGGRQPRLQGGDVAVCRCPGRRRGARDQGRPQHRPAQRRWRHRRRAAGRGGRGGEREAEGPERAAQGQGPCRGGGLQEPREQRDGARRVRQGGWRVVAKASDRAAVSRPSPLPPRPCSPRPCSTSSDRRA